MTHDSQLKQVTIAKVTKLLSRKVTIAGSKSLTNRALIFASLAKGKSTISNVLISDDTKVLISALVQMGVDITFSTPTTIVVNSIGTLNPPKDTLFLGNAGTATRFLTAVCCLVDGKVVIDGDEYMRKRPISPLINALKSMDIDIDCPTGCPPVRIQGNRKITTDSVVIDGDLSSQYVSALLMIAPYCDQRFEIKMKNAHIGGRGYIDLTLALMKKFGITVEETQLGWQVKSQVYVATDYKVEPDASSITYIWAIEALTNTSLDTGFDYAEMTQPDAKSYQIIKSFPNFPDVIDGSQFQDAIPTLAVMSAFTGKKVRFTGIENLRVKECDRISALCEGLCKIHENLAIEEGDDLIVNGDIDLSNLSGSKVLIDSKDDHRMAMAFSLAGIMLGDIAISNCDCVTKTFPTYWEELAKIGVMLEY